MKSTELDSLTGAREGEKERARERAGERVVGEEVEEWLTKTEIGFNVGEKKRVEGETKPSSLSLSKDCTTIWQLGPLYCMTWCLTLRSGLDLSRKGLWWKEGRQKAQFKAYTSTFLPLFCGFPVLSKISLLFFSFCFNNHRASSYRRVTKE